MNLFAFLFFIHTTQVFTISYEILLFAKFNKLLRRCPQQVVLTRIRVKLFCRYKDLLDRELG